jgi:hypothetical protein
MAIQVYRAILGLRENEPVGEMYHASAGLLLDPALHKAFDRLDFSFYYRVSIYSYIFSCFPPSILIAIPCGQDGILYAHFFRLDLQNALLCHGMAIPHTRFNIRSTQYWPKPEYLQWHYRQCLMARMRGFSA